MESRVFSTPESGAISDRWTAVRIEGGNDLDEEGRAFMQRYGLRSYPSLLAITAGGALLDRDLKDGRLRDAAYLYRAMEQADGLNRRFIETREELLAADDTESRVKLAGLHAARLEFGRASKLYEQAFAEEPTEDLVQRRLVLLARMGDRDAEGKLLDDAIEGFPEAEEHMGWRMRRVTLHIEPPSSPEEEDANAELHTEAIETLRQEVAEAGDVAGEATIRTTLARIEHGRGRTAESQAHLDWVFEHAPEGRSARVGHLHLARAALGKRVSDEASKHATWVIEKAPESLEAAGAHMVLGDLAYNDHDIEGMETHYQAVIDLVPGSSMAGAAQEALQWIARFRKREGN